MHTDPGEFVLLVADLLSAEGFRIRRIEGVGSGLVAGETFASHLGQVSTAHWLVACHCGSGSEPDYQGLLEFILRDESNLDGLLLVTDAPIRDSDHLLGTFSESKALLKVWDHKELTYRLLRHPILLKKHEWCVPPTSLSPVLRDADFDQRSILIFSDGSPLSLQIYSTLSGVCRDLQLLTALQYQSVLDVEFMFREYLTTRHDLILFFLGDSFGLTIPDVILECVRSNTKAGGAVILFPFFAWVRGRGLYENLEHLIPVRLAGQRVRDERWIETSRITTQRDIHALNTDVFIENQYVTIPGGDSHACLHGLTEEFGFAHSFEFLELKDSGTALVSDTRGNPLLIANDLFRQPVLYLNSCTHNCLTRAPLISPYQVSRDYARFVENSIVWALEGVVQ